jgi:putative SOS response-associated peptidase YedK
MCGRYILRQLSEAERYFALERVEWNFKASYNIAPTQQVPIVRLGKDGVREGIMMRWGLIPYWAHGEPPKFSTINATIEKLDSAPAWRGPWERGRRCVIPANGFYEWHLGADGAKSPHLIRLADQPLFGFAGLWDGSRAEDGTVIRSCAIVTMPGNALMRDIHNTGSNPYRMPAILRVDDHEAWLAGKPEEAKRALIQYPDDRMDAYRVSTRVNSPKNDDEQLMEPVESADKYLP